MASETIIPSGWTMSSMQDIADARGRAIVSGPFGSNIGSKFFVEDGVPVIRGNNLTTDMRRFLDSGFVFVTNEKADELGNCDAVEDDLIFTAAGTLGQVGIIPAKAKYPRYIISNKQLRARLDKQKVHPLFAFYWFSSPQMRDYIQQLNTGSTVPLINLSVLRSLPIPLPPMRDQRRIVDILDSLDSKIELNDNMNETLEVMARTLFKSWFVDFDPVRAKAEGGFTDLPDHIAHLFPDSFENSELGQIPKGWLIGDLGRIAFLNPESWSKTTRPGIIQYVDLANTKWGRIESVTPYSRDDAPSRAQRVLRPGDTIVGTVRPGNGSYSLVMDNGLTGSTGFAVLRPKAPECRELVYLAATAPNNIDRLAHLADGGAYPAISAEMVLPKQFVLPPEALIRQFSTLVSPLTFRLADGARESRTLMKTRDALLPKLISGELHLSIDSPIGGANN